MAPDNDQETDLSSESESFSSTFTNARKPPPKFNKNDKSNVLILRAARLELESITLKQTMEEAVKKLQELAVTDVTTLVKQVAQIHQDLEVLKVASKLDQTTIDRATQEFANIRHAIISYCSLHGNNSSHVIDEMRGVRFSVEDQLSKMYNIIGNTQILLHQFNIHQQSIEEKLDIQRLDYESLRIQMLAQNKDILEIKQFLQLLVPRIVGIENSIHSLVNQAPATAATSVTGTPKTEPKKRKLM
ncbi:hypothetical protein Cantr_00629 [Candida viswanathii]|uniref:Uncharacterized protein n=1 Tax=Candida viswanathii TaxID=5486 RepID=A0A367YGQ4_9ASCO|nr:hypothetical protein Cantr_00629 [Candida viswanathii]